MIYERDLIGDIYYEPNETGFKYNKISSLLGSVDTFSIKNSEIKSPNSILLFAMLRTMLTDQHWQKLKAILRNLSIHHNSNLRNFIEAILYRIITGCPW